MSDLDTKQAIIDAVQRHGCLSKTELCHVTGRGWGNICYHLYDLEAVHEVEVERNGRYTCILNPRLDSETRGAALALQDARRVEVASGLCPSGEVTITDLAERMGKSRKFIRTHLLPLVDSGLVDQRGQRPHRYRAKDTKWSIVTSILKRRRSPPREDA